MRQLTDEERELTEMGLDKNKKEKYELEANLTYNLDLIEKQKYLREFDNKWREFLQKQKDIEDQKVIDMIKAEIKNKEQLILTAERHLSEGVETKLIPTGVE